MIRLSILFLNILNISR